MRWTHSPYGIALCATVLFEAQIARNVQAQGSILGLVTDQAKAPVRDAEVLIEKIPAVTKTDSTGHFRFRSLPPGLHRVTVRRLGYAPASVDIGLKDQETVSVQVELTQRAQPLPEVPVEGSTSSLGSRFSDFERRRSSGVGQFLTLEDLASERSKPLGDVLVRLRGVYLVRSAAAACLTSTRGAQSVRNAASGYCGNQSVDGAYCPVAVFMNGHPAYTGHSEEIFNLNAMHADEVAGVEYYSGSGTLPREFGAPRGTCGALVIWTKR